jgi:uncharacterized protein YaaW (UPF0174 family)
MNNIFSQIKSGDIYALLANCSQQDLDPLVESIINRFSNSMDINETYKTCKPNHTKYTNLIADEIRLYGGNSVSNTARGGKGPSYDEVLFDVCQKINIPSKKGKILENEENLLNLCLPNNWKILHQLEQQKAVKDAREKYKTYGGIITSGAGTATLVTGAVFKTAMRSAYMGATVLAVTSVADPAFTVTIPCVLQIAYLRWKLLKHMKKDTLQIANDYTKQNKPLIVKRESPLILGENAESPILTFALAEISEVTSVNWQPISNSDDTGISRFNSLLQVVPNLVTKAHIATTQYVESNISLESLALVKDSLDEHRGFVRGANGEIIEHVKLTSADNLHNIFNAAALFQVASVIVAQKHLADINQKLTEIKKTVDDIHKFQKDERETNMTGAIDYFKQIAPSILAGELRNSYESQIEKYEGELLSIRNHLVKDIRNLNSEIKNLKNTDMLGSEGMQRAIENHQNKIFSLYQQLLLCIKARAYGWQLLLAFNRTEHISKARKNDIYESLVLLNIDGELVNATIVEMGEKIHSLDAVTNTKLTLNERKLTLLKWQDNLIEKITSTKHEIKTRIDFVSSSLEDSKNVNFLLKIENGKVVARTPL